MVGGREEWSIGVVKQSLDDIVARGIVEPVQWVEPNPWRILADPFCYQQDGRIVVLAENMSHWEGRGEIWKAVLPDDGRLTAADFELYAACPIHLSYPFRMEEDGRAYFTAESYESGGLHLWREDGQSVTYVKCLMSRPAVDATFHHDGTLWWLFCTFADDGANQRLHLFYSQSLLGEWQPHPQNPVQDTPANARPAGRLFMSSEGLIRPAQDCSKSYGGSLVLNRVVRLTPRSYRETPIRLIEPNHPYFKHGIHTIAGAGDYTVIDGKKWHDGVTDIPRRVIAKGFKMRRLARPTIMAKTMAFASHR